VVKRNKQRAKDSKSARRDKETAASDDAADSVALEPHPPAKQPVLLGISTVLFVLFVLWLIFLLVTAWPR
jgi:hypothetical protein